MGKYQEIMEHIELTEEAKERILGNIAQKQKRRKTIQIVRIVSAAAACFVVVFGAAYYLKTRPEEPTQQPVSTETSAVQMTGSVTETTAAVISSTAQQTAVSSSIPKTSSTMADTPGSPLTEYKSAAELREATGLPIYDVNSMPFKVTKTTYMGCGNFADISYYSGDDLCCIRVSKDESDQSGFYFDEDTIETKETEINGVKVTLTTDIAGTYLASWIQDGQFHSVGLIASNNAETILPIVSEILAQKPNTLN